MGGQNRSVRTARRRPDGHASLVRTGNADLGWVAALLVVAVVVAIISVGGPIWEVLAGGDGYLN